METQEVTKRRAEWERAYESLTPEEREDFIEAWVKKQRKARKEAQTRRDVAA